MGGDAEADKPVAPGTIAKLRSFGTRAMNGGLASPPAPEGGEEGEEEIENILRSPEFLRRLSVNRAALDMTLRDYGL